MSSRETVRCRAVSRVVFRLGTRGTLGRYRRESPGLGTRDTWLSRKASGGDFPGLGTRDTWHTRKTSGGILPVWALGTRGSLGRVPGKVPLVCALGTGG